MMTMIVKYVNIISGRKTMESFAKYLESGKGTEGRKISKCQMLHYKLKQPYFHLSLHFLDFPNPVVRWVCTHVCIFWLLTLYILIITNVRIFNVGITDNACVVVYSRLLKMENKQHQKNQILSWKQQLTFTFLIWINVK